MLLVTPVTLDPRTEDLIEVCNERRHHHLPVLGQHRRALPFPLHHRRELPDRRFVITGRGRSLGQAVTDRRLAVRSPRPRSCQPVTSRRVCSSASATSSASEIAAAHEVDADPASVSELELGLDTARSATIAPVWAALLTGSAESQGRGTPFGDEIRDATGRVPHLWFGDDDEHEGPRQRFHLEVYVAPEVAEARIAAVLAAGGTVVDDSDAPSLTVIADQDGNRGVVCVDVSAAKTN